MKHGFAARAPEYVEELCGEGRGVLFATAHLGNWELSAYAHALGRAHARGGAAAR